jgi:UPF0271 protein
MAQSQRKLINLNADMGESYGRFALGHDAEMVQHVKSINVACGYHAADPGTMLKSVRLAKSAGVELGAHISYPDLMGFGRRTMGLTEQEVFEITVYQIGALYGFCLAEEVRITHVKPHGQLYLTGVRDQATARGIVRAVASVDPNLLLLMYGDIVAAECKSAEITMVHEAYVDLDYFADGSLVLDKAREARKPDQIAERALSLVEKGGIEAVDGSWLKIPTQSICLHGDMANAPDLASAVKRRLEDVGYEIAGLSEMVGQRQSKRIAARGFMPAT